MSGRIFQENSGQLKEIKGVWIDLHTQTIKLNEIIAEVAENWVATKVQKFDQSERKIDTSDCWTVNKINNSV